MQRRNYQIAFITQLHAIIMIRLPVWLTVCVAVFSPSPTFCEDGIRTFYSNANTAFHIKFHKNGDNDICTIFAMDTTRKYRGFKDGDGEDLIHVMSKKAQQPLADTILPTTDNSKIIEIYGTQEGIVRAHMELLCKSSVEIPHYETAQSGTHQEPEVVKIVDGGDQANRIDVVFMGDGYTAGEREKFFSDMNRLTEEMFEGVTFRSYLPLFNIWAIYVESVDSGIGYDGPKNTPFGLYRDSGQLRGIFPSNYTNARNICTLTGVSGCDYPSIIGNDDYYGGLGGEFVISTKSNRTGTVVLRHEMGHNFVYVGEEYDNGQAYFGVNYASNVSNLGWSHWLSGAAREERAQYRLLEYPWHDLSQGSRNFTFLSDGGYSRWYLLVSVSAAGEDDSLEFILDGQILPWNSSGFDDREFYSWSGEEGFSDGEHNFSVRSKTASTNPDIPRMICSINLHEYGSEEEFKMSNDYVSAYPTWDYRGTKSFRPTNEGCLMRNMTHNSLCNICREGMWYEFFKTVSIIDNVTVVAGAPGELSTVTVNTLKVAHLRQPGNEVEGEQLQIHWFRNNTEQEELKDMLEIAALGGSWRVEVEFITPEVRNDPNDLLKDSATVIVPEVVPATTVPTTNEPTTPNAASPIRVKSTLYNTAFVCFLLYERIRCI